MAKRTLAEMKAAFASTNNQQSGGPRENNYYPFWDMDVDQRAVVRFVPDLNDENPRGFLIERVFHNLTINGQRQSVPCLSMYGEECPICKLSQEYYRNNDEENGKKYYKKRQYIAQALIVDDPLPADKVSGENHQGKVRYIALGYQIYNIIKEAFASEDLEASPDDFQDGYDFYIKKTESGKYAAYNIGTKFAARSRALTEDELEVVREGMTDLITVLPKNPGVDKVRELLNADLNGGSDDNEEFEQPQRAPAMSSAKPSSRPAPRKVEEDEEDEDDSTPPPKAAAKPAKESAGDSSMDDMLAAIRERRAAQRKASE